MLDQVKGNGCTGTLEMKETSSFNGSGGLNPYCQVITTERGELMIRGPLSGQEIAAKVLDPEMRAFRPPDLQLEALREIADLDQGLIFAAISGEVIVGYVTFHPPEPFERWGQINRPEVLMLGAIEVSPRWRGSGLARLLVQAAFTGGRLDCYIVVATEYSWHWDLDGTKLSPWDYRRILEKVFNSAGMEAMATDDPEINYHPANVLMVRVGPCVSEEAAQAFHQVRFLNQGGFKT